MIYAFLTPVLLLMLAVAYGLYPAQFDQPSEIEKHLELEQRIEALEASSLRHQERIDTLYEMRSK